MKTKLIPILTLAAATCPAITAFADLEQRDSSQFTHKYEMLKLPTAEDVDGSGAYDFTGINANATWCTLGTGSNTGTVYMAISGGQNLTSSANNGTAGDVWKNLGVTAASGYTIETRLKVTSCTGTAGTLLLNASYGVQNHNSWLQFYGDKITWGSTIVTNMDTSNWHTYRLVGTNNAYSVYIDGILAKGSLGNGYGYSTALNRLIFGGGGGSYGGAAQVAYLRFTKGAYAPLVPNDKSRRKASEDFLVKYEMDGDKISATGTTTEWKKGGSGATIRQTNGKLSVDMTTKVQAYWDSQDAIWKNLVSADTPYTVEFKVKINSSLVAGDRTMVFLTGSKAGPVGQIFIGKNSTQWQVTSSMGDNITLDGSDNSGWHVFRIAYSGGGRHAFTVWRDGEKIGESLVDCQNYYAYSGNALAIARFGVSSSGNSATHGGSFDIDYVRWDIGTAWDWKNPRKGMMVVIR